MWSRLGRGRGKKVGGGCGWMARVAFLGDRLPSPPKFQRSKVKKKRQQQQLFWDHSAPAVCDHIWLNHLLTVRNNNVTSSSSSTTRHRQWEEEEEACRHASFNEPLLLSLSFPTSHSTDLSLPLCVSLSLPFKHTSHINASYRHQSIWVWIEGIERTPPVAKIEFTRFKSSNYEMDDIKCLLFFPTN